MISLTACIACAALALFLWTSVGLAVARYVMPDHGLAVAPALGYALLNAAALPLFIGVGMTVFGVRLGLGLVLVTALAILIGTQGRVKPARSSAIPAGALLLAALLALGPALADMPKTSADGTAFAIQIFDHAKVALIDEIARSGVPPANPFIGAAAGSDGLAYYYLWYFAAALIALATGSTGWEADIALTWATAFSSLALMIGISVVWSQKRSSAYWVVLVSFAVSLRPFLTAALCGDDFGNWISGYPGLQAWFVQASWVPQHLAAADCVCLLPLLLTRLGGIGHRCGIVVLALVVAAGFESSTYVGGLMLAAASPFLALSLMASTPAGQRAKVLWQCLPAALLTLALIAPFLHQQFEATAARGVGVPIRLYLFEVFDSKVPQAIRRWLDAPGYWLVQLPVDLPAISIFGLWSLATTSFRRRLTPQSRLFAVITLVGLIIPWLFESTIANNDLGWRALLPAVIGLTLFSAVFLARTDWTRPTPWLALIPMVLGLYGGASYLGENLRGDTARADSRFAAGVELWRAARRYAGPTDRLANNPAAFADIVKWPVNLSWALLANRRSCYAARELVLPYSTLPIERVDVMADLFHRVFAGTASEAEVRSLARDDACRVIVLTPEDGAWANDPFAKEPLYTLMEERPDQWRIYRAQTENGESR